MATSAPFCSALFCRGLEPNGIGGFRLRQPTRGPLLALWAPVLQMRRGAPACADRAGLSGGPLWRPAPRTRPPNLRVSRSAPLRPFCREALPNHFRRRHGRHHRDRMPARVRGPFRILALRAASRRGHGVRSRAEALRCAQDRRPSPSPRPEGAARFFDVHPPQRPPLASTASGAALPDLTRFTARSPKDDAAPRPFFLARSPAIVTECHIICCHRVLRWVSHF